MSHGEPDQTHQDGPQKRACLIVFEGCDRTGKTTQAKHLFNSLQCHQIPCKIMKFPNGNDSTTHGIQLDQHLKGKTNYSISKLQTMFADQRHEKMQQMKQALLNGVNVICDRYSYSGIAYSAANDADFYESAQLENQLLNPDIVFMLELDIQHLPSRPAFGEETYENTCTQVQVAHYYSKIKAFVVNTSRVRFVSIDASQSIQHLRNQINSHTLSFLNKFKHNPLPLTLQDWSELNS